MFGTPLAPADPLKIEKPGGSLWFPFVSAMFRLFNLSSFAGKVISKWKELGSQDKCHCQRRLSRKSTEPQNGDAGRKLGTASATRFR